jgi:hypothetical protein
MSSTPAYGPVAHARLRDPLLAEWGLRGAVALILFAGFFALGRGTAHVSGVEATAPTPLSAPAHTATAPFRRSEDAPLEGAFRERATLERLETERALAAASAKRARHAGAAGAGARASAEATPFAAAEAPVRTQSAPASLTAPHPQNSASAPAPRRSSSRGSSGAGTSFDSSG